MEGGKTFIVNRSRFRGDTRRNGVLTVRGKKRKVRPKKKLEKTNWQGNELFPLGKEQKEVGAELGKSQTNVPLYHIQDPKFR